MPFERLEIETFPFFSLKLLIYATLSPQTHFTFSNARQRLRWNIKNRKVFLISVTRKLEEGKRSASFQS